MKLLVVLAIVLGGCSARSTPRPQSADMVLIGGRVVTNDAKLPRAEAIAVRAGRIAAVGSDAEIRAYVGPSTRSIALAGTWVLPGLVDAHAHLAGLGDALANIDLTGTRSYDEVLARVAERAAKQPSGWLVGRGWDQNDWPEQQFPDGRALERVAPGRAVWLRRIDGHAGLASPTALAQAGVIKETTDPDGGRVVRDAAGAPTGVLVDTAMDLVEPKIPAPSPAEQAARLERALGVAHSVGITEVHDMGTSTATLELFQRMARGGKLPIRVYVVLSGSDPRLAEHYARGPRSGEMISVRAVKFFADGALGSRGAALAADYSDDPGNRGLFVMAPESLTHAIERAVEAGFQPSVHAIGDRANTVVLDAFAKVGAPARAVRPRIEHAQVLAPSDIPRFRALGVVASMQPMHATSDLPWAEKRLGPDRMRGAYAWKSLLDAGATLAFGSDFPVERPHILEGLRAALSRPDEQRLDFASALAGFTTGAAYAGFVEGRRGKIVPGYDADLTLLRTSEAELTATALATAEVSMTIVAGVMHVPIKQ